MARPDLTAEESAQAMTEALAPVSFGEGRAALLKEVVFGGASAASRPVLAVAAVRGALARADAVYTANATGLEQHADAMRELFLIYEFIDERIANAGHPTGAAHDAQGGIPETAYTECVKALADHATRAASVLKGAPVVGPVLRKVRAQASLAMMDLFGDTATRRLDVADRLGLTGARRAFLTELGVLLFDSGRADQARVERVRDVLNRLPAARVGAEAIYFGDDHPGLKARQQIVSVASPLEATSQPGTDAAWGDDVEAGPIDAGLVAATRDLVTLAVRRALDNRAELRVRADRDAEPGKTDAQRLLGRVSGEPTGEAELAAAVSMLMIDAPRTMDLAFARWLAQKSEPAALLSDALGLLAAYAPATTGSDGLTLALGRAKPDGSTETISATQVRLAPSGAATAFTLAGHNWSIQRDDATGAVRAVHRDGAPVTLAMLPTARVPLTSGNSWRDGSLVFARLQGTPRAGVAVDGVGANSGSPMGRVRLLGTGAKGFDAIATPAPADDCSVEAELAVRGGVGGIVVRAVTTVDAYRGVSLVVTPGATSRAALVANDGAGNETQLAGPVDLPAGASWRVKLTVKQAAVEATIGGMTLRATAPAAMAHGDVAFRAAQGASVEARGLAVRRAP